MQRLAEASLKFKASASRPKSATNEEPSAEQQNPEASTNHSIVGKRKNSQATQTVCKLPKVYLTQAWKYTTLAGVDNQHPPVDFRHYQMLGSMRNDFYRPCVREGLNIDHLEHEPSFMRVLREGNRLKTQTMADNLDSKMRSELFLGNFASNRLAQTQTAVDSLPFANDDLWFTRVPEKVENEIGTNKAFVKDFLRSSRIFDSRTVHHMLQLKKARRTHFEVRKHTDVKKGPKNKPPPGEIKEESFLKEIAAARVRLTARTQPKTDVEPVIYDLPPNSVHKYQLPVLKDDKECSVDNLADVISEIFRYANRQKTLMKMDTVVMYIVKKIDGPIVVLEKYPPRRLSQYVHAIPESLQFGFQPHHFPRPEHEQSSVETPEMSPSRNTLLPNARLTAAMSLQMSISRSQQFLRTRRATVAKEPDSLLELTVDYRKTDDLITKVLLQQTWFRIVNLKGYLAHGGTFLPNVPDDARSSIIIPVGLHDGRMLGLISFVRCGKKPNFTAPEAELLFTHISFLTRYRYYTGMRNDQCRAQERMHQEMHSILQMKENAADDFLHHTLMLVKNLTDADRSSSFLVTTLIESLRSERQIIPHHLETGAKDPITGYASYRKGNDIRMSVESGIVGCAYRHRRTYASVATQHDKHFFSEIDKMLANKTDCLVCVPFLMGDEPYGMVEVLNKRGSSRFSDHDVSLLHLNSIFPALGILVAWYRFHCNKFECLMNLWRAKTSYMRKRRFHRSTRLFRPLDEMKTIPDPLPAITPDMLGVDFFHVNYLSESVSLTMALIKDMINDKSKINDAILYGFVEYVRNSHFRTRFHDWKHAFATLHAIYVVVKQAGSFFTDDDKLTMIVGGLCHAIDHFSYNAAIGEGLDPPRGSSQIYSITTPESGTFYGMMAILQDATTNMFHFYRDKKWRKLVESSRRYAGSAHLPNVLSRIRAVQKILDNAGFHHQDTEHKQIIKELVTTAASLNYACKPFPLYQELTKCAYEEYADAAREIQTFHGGAFCPRWEVDANDRVTYASQASFLKQVCQPVFNALATCLPQTRSFYDCCQKNIEKLEETTSSSVAVQELGLETERANTGSRPYDEISTDLKECMRRDPYAVPGSSSERTVEWIMLSEIPYLFARKHQR